MKVRKDEITLVILKTANYINIAPNVSSYLIQQKHRIYHNSYIRFDNTMISDESSKIFLFFLTFPFLSWSRTSAKSKMTVLIVSWSSASLTHDSRVAHVSANSRTSWLASRRSRDFWPAFVCTEDQSRFMSASAFCIVCFSLESGVCLIRSPPLVRNLSNFCLNGSNSDTSSWSRKHIVYSTGLDKIQ